MKVMLLLLILCFIGCSNNPKINISFPKSNIYNEFDSCDGWALLGLAKALNNENYSSYIDSIEIRKFSSGEWFSRGHLIPNYSNLVYYLWTSYIFYDYIGKNTNEIMNRIDSIGYYKNGWIRYCDPEIYYYVPNVQSAAAYMFAKNGQIEKANHLLEILKKEQLPNGNWQYYNLDSTLTIETSGVQEDCFHLAMMTYQLREIKDIPGLVDIEIMYLKALYNLEYYASTMTNCCYGSQGWGVPMTYICLNNVNKKTKDKYKNLTIDYLNHKNFRVRAFSCFALALDGYFKE